MCDKDNLKGMLPAGWGVINRTVSAADWEDEGVRSRLLCQEAQNDRSLVCWELGSGAYVVYFAERVG